MKEGPEEHGIMNVSVMKLTHMLSGDNIQKGASRLNVCAPAVLCFGSLYAF